MLDLDNNDFNQGFAGWTLQSGVVTNAFTTGHVEQSLPPSPCSDCIGRGQEHEEEPATGPRSTEAASGEAPAVVPQSGDVDVILQTKNKTVPHTLRRVFQLSPGTSAIRVRYRFQSMEVYRNWWVNDYYQVRMTSSPSNTIAQDAQNVNTLRFQFDSNASTPWFELTLLVPQGDTSVELLATVGNAADNAENSWLYLDQVQAVPTQVVAEVVDLIDPGDPYEVSRPEKPISRLSLSAHTYYPSGTVVGNTRIHGGLRITGPATTVVTDIVVQIMQAGVVRATGQLSNIAGARTALLNRTIGAGLSFGYGPGGALLGIAPLLFEIPTNESDNFDQTLNEDNLFLDIVVTTSTGTVRQRIPRAMTKYILYTLPHRDGDRDPGPCTGLKANDPALRKRPPFPCGGDDWAVPTVKLWTDQISSFYRWNDFSNMNGGFFPPMGATATAGPSTENSRATMWCDTCRRR